MTTNSTALTEKSKRFSFRVPPEYKGGRILILTPDEAKRIAKGLLLDPDARDAADPLLQWAEEVYFVSTQS